MKKPANVWRTGKRSLHCSNNCMNIKPKVAILSGGMGGIGRAIAQRLAVEGKRVCVLYHKSPKAEADAFVASLPGSNHLALACDITKAEEVSVAVATAHERLGGLDIAIHAAVSPLVREKASAIDPLAFKQQFEVTAFGGLNFFQAVIPSLRAQKSGHLIGITTAALDSGALSGMAGYVCAKYALRGLLHELALELAPHIRVDEIAPGFVPTGLHADLPEQVRAFITERAPGQTPGEVADMVSKLLPA